jgi:hypothetical protein
MTKITYVYEFLYNDDTNDSGASTISIHRTKKGAVKAMRIHKVNVRLKHLERVESLKNDPDQYMYRYYKKQNWKWAKWWGVRKVELND